MEFNDLRVLLKKYELGETSLQEERDLRNYFNAKDVPQEFEVYKKIFKFMKESKEIEYSKNVQFTSTPKRKWLFTGIAASILIIMSFLFFNDLTNRSLDEQNLGTIEDPEQAYIKTKETLKMVADIFNEGKEDLEYLNEFNRTKNKFITEQ